MNQLVFDIETAGEEFSSLDIVSQNLLEKKFKRTAQNEEELEEEKEKLSFFAPTNQIVAIGMLNPQTKNGLVYFQNKEKISLKEEGVEYLSFSSEKELLLGFWEIITPYQQFITFNGYNFDVPVLMLRSAMNEIRPSKNLMTNRYLERQPYNLQHIDLADQLSFYGAKKDYLSLHFWTRAFNIDSPKEGELTGEKVTQYFREGKTLEIAKYCFKDVIATAALFEKWEKYLKF
ncbi:MAG TPA: ribonuclease H-like domain-containing protein [Candidatus Paceibacterota bacterium]|jgi:hypothetical protein|nr:ribonuclease H-like domain-containing protein [Candidatus Paceibacterota bacterium]HRS47774.1 ribonuclease H-like domain-containing protein [Candidatus Paceibacterota bacterium]